MAYSDDQPRDKQGQWTSGGGRGAQPASGSSASRPTDAHNANPFAAVQAGHSAADSAVRGAVSGLSRQGNISSAQVSKGQHEDVHQAMTKGGFQHVGTSDMKMNDEMSRSTSTYQHPDHPSVRTEVSFTHTKGARSDSMRVSTNSHHQGLY